MTKNHKNNKSNKTNLKPTGKGAELIGGNGIKLRSPEELSKTALDWRTRISVIELLGASPAYLQAEYAQFLADELRMAQMLPGTASKSGDLRLLVEDEVDSVLVHDGRDIGPRETTHIGAVSFAITAAERSKLGDFKRRLSEFFVNDPQSEEPRLSFRDVIPLEVRGFNQSYQEVEAIIDHYWQGCSDARGGHFWDDHYCFRIDLGGGPHMVAKLAERLKIDLKVEIWDSETHSRVEYVQNVNGTVKGMRSYGFKFTDDFVSCVYDGLKERMSRKEAA